jgi:D-alanyl-D-alanine carboxypeptidase
MSQRSVRRHLRTVLGVSAALGGLALAGLVAAPAASADTRTAPSRDVVQQSLDRLVREDKFPAALAAVREPRGRTRNYTAGVADLATGAKVPVDGRVRIASNTKMFTATVVLQLVGEGRIDLDAPVETYLPNVVRGNGNDGRRITVRQLLQHTSGLPDYDDVIFKDFLAALHTHHEPRDLVDVALTKPAESVPGEKFSYSNTNYVLAGLIVQKVTGRPVGEEITNRIIKRLGLRDTYWPPVGEQTLRGPHPRGYFPALGDDPAVDITDSDTSAGWAAGQLVGTPSDLNRFMVALLGGELLKPEQLAQMKTTVEAPDFDMAGGARYGLGLATFKLSCGGVAWTHGGTAPGYLTSNGVNAQGRAATVAVTAMAGTEAAAKHIEVALDTALCR